MVIPDFCAMVIEFVFAAPGVGCGKYRNVDVTEGNLPYAISSP